MRRGPDRPRDERDGWLRGVAWHGGRPIDRFQELNDRIVGCRLCPRLVEWRERVAKERKREFAQCEYWGRPVPNFGDPRASRLIVGLAPAAHGANRTGRMFTGDRSGEWLYRALHKAGVASQPFSAGVGDGLALDGVAITAAIHCAPPGNRPNAEEFLACRGYLGETISLADWEAILCLGGIAWKETHRVLGVREAPFSHGASHRAGNGCLLVASYHPSQQNTFTGRLTEAMLDQAVATFLS